MSKVIAIGDGEFAAFQANNDAKLQLLVFSAPWCGPCRAMAPAVDDVAADYPDTTAVGRICIDTAPTLAARFNVRSVPTLILLRGEEELVRSTGALSRTRLGMMLDRALATGAECA